MLLGYFPGNANGPLRHHRLDRFQGFFDAMRGFINHRRYGRTADHVQLLTKDFVLFTQKSHKAKSTDIHARKGHRANRGIGTRHNAHINLRFPARRDEHMPGVRNDRHSRVGNQSDIFATLQSSDKSAANLFLIKFVIRRHRCLNVIIIEQFSRMPRIFGRDEIRLFEGADRAKAHVLQITDGRSDNRQRSFVFCFQFFSDRFVSLYNL